MKRTILNIAMILAAFVGLQSCTEDNEDNGFTTGPTADFTIDPEKGEIGADIIFTDASKAAEGATLKSWSWDFGQDDKSVSTEQNPTFVYTKDGEFTVTLTVTDSNNKFSKKQKTILVKDPADRVSVAWQTDLLGNTQATLSPAMSADGAVAYMWSDQSTSNPENAFDVQLKAYNVADGTVKWSFDVNAEWSKIVDGGGVRLVYSSPVVGNDGNVYVAARDLKNDGDARKSLLLAVAPDGKLAWSYNYGFDANFNWNAPAVDYSGNIYLLHRTNTPMQITKLTSAGVATTMPLTTDPEVEVENKGGIALDNQGNIYFGGTDNTTYKYSAAGAKEWNSESLGAAEGALAIGADGTIYLTTEGSAGVVALNADGSKKWSYEILSGGAKNGGVAVGDGVVYAAAGAIADGNAEAGGIVALNLDGTKKWAYPTDESVTQCTPLIDNRGYVHFITDAGTYYVIQDNGEFYGSKNLGEASTSSPVMNDEGKVVVVVVNADGDNKKSIVVGVDTGAEGVADTAWPMKGQNLRRTSQQVK